MKLKFEDHIKKGEMGNCNYRLGVGLMIVNDQKKVLVGKRIHFIPHAHILHPSKIWQMPQGGIDNLEQPEEAVFREMQEEIGSNKGRIVATSTNLLSYEFPLHIQKNSFNGLYKGQLQRWFLIEFIGDEAEIRVDQVIPEFTEWKWVAFSELVGLVVDFKQELYKEIVKEFAWYFK